MIPSMVERWRYRNDREGCRQSIVLLPSSSFTVSRTDRIDHTAKERRSAIMRPTFVGELLLKRYG